MEDSSPLRKSLSLVLKLFTNAIHTREILLNRHVLEFDEAVVCSFCRQEQESLLHIFFHCPLAKQVWSKIGDWLEMSIQHCNNMEEHFNSFGAVFSGKKAYKMKYIVWLATC